MGTSAQLVGALRRSFDVVAHAGVRDRVEPGRLAEEQAALRRVATLVACGASSAEVFAAVAMEVAQVMHLPMVGVFRYDSDGAAMTVIAESSDRPHALQPGTRWPLDGPSMVAEVLRTGRPARVEDYADLAGTLAAGARESGLIRTAGAPIIVDGRVWGVMATASPDAPLPDRVEDRLVAFTELVATAISSSQAHEDLRRLADEQAALRRVATLVAQGAPSAEVFASVAKEVSQVLHLANVAVCRYDDAGAVMTVVAVWGDRPDTFQPGTRWPLDGPSMSAEVLRTGRPARVEDYSQLPGSLAAEAREHGFSRVAGAPIVVDGRVWGVISTSSPKAPLPDHLEDRLGEFTELVATAIANSQAREELTRLAEEQAALRRVATLVAQGASPAAVFEAVSAEIAQLVPAEGAALTRFETDGKVTPLGGWTRSGGYVHVGTRFALEGTVSGLVFETGRPARVDSYAEAPGAAAAAGREMGWRSSVGAPITVEGRLWGVLAVASISDRGLPPDTEERLAEFTNLVATAIANAESRAELDASRARIVATADATRRRIERDLHDGAQQQLVSLALELRAAQAAAPPELGQHRAELSRVVDGLTSVLDGLREIALGIHPAILAEGGLGPALNTLARRSPLPVKLDVRAERRLPERVEVAAYYVVSEALTNAAKYARASVVHVAVETRDRILRVAVRDDGLGGADPARGSGLLGLKDRAEAIGGTISLQSPRGAGTSLHVELPLDEHDE